MVQLRFFIETLSWTPNNTKANMYVEQIKVVSVTNQEEPLITKDLIQTLIYMLYKRDKVSSGRCFRSVSEVFHLKISDVNVTTETTSTRAQISRLSSTHTRSTKSVKKHSRKVTVVSGAITFIFIISYVPYFI